VFQGTADGRLAGYGADTGELLWQASIHIGIMAPPVSYQLDDEQYLTVVAGSGGAGLPQAESLRHLENTGRVLTFKLGGTAPIPPVAEKPVPDAPIPAPFGAPEQIARGELLYLRHCSRCHGGDVESNGLIRDLRYAGLAVHASWNAIVLDGAYEALGMAGFGDILDDMQAEDIRSYVVARANATRRAPDKAVSAAPE
jgi:quinohemoprotein ethanol dehydrogenase